MSCRTLDTDQWWIKLSMKHITMLFDLFLWNGVENVFFLFNCNTHRRKPVTTGTNLCPLLTTCYIKLILRTLQCNTCATYNTTLMLSTTLNYTIAIPVPTL